MIDYFALGLTHALLTVMLFRILGDDAIDPIIARPKRRSPRSDNAQDAPSESASDPAPQLTEKRRR